jgi:septum formation protein
MVRFVLASQSPRRKFFLQKRGYLFHTFPVEISEILDENLSIERAVEDLAHRKAMAAVQMGQLEPGLEYIILAADTIVHHQGLVLGKPLDTQDAVKTLKKLSGQTHQVITAFCLLHGPSGETILDHEISNVTFRKLLDSEIEAYVATGDPMDKAGSYGIQSLAKGFQLEMGDPFQAQRRDFVVDFTGTLENIAGLPVAKMEEALAKKNWVLPKRV